MNGDTSLPGLTEEQTKALYDPVRIRIAHLLKTPRTPKQVAEIINIKANNLYYHFRILEKAGIIKQVKSKQGKGFIKENFFKLKSPEYMIIPEIVPLDTRRRLFKNLIRAAMEDLAESLEKEVAIAGIGTRDDFNIPYEKLHDARKLILARTKVLMKDLEKIAVEGEGCDYQINFFGFRL